MIKKVATLCTVVVGLILSVTYMASGSTISASQSLPELPDRSAAVSGLSGSYRAMAAVDPCDVDFNGNGVVDVDDIMAVANCWRMTDNDPDWDARYDLAGDGIITIVDIMLVAAQWGNSCTPSGPRPPYGVQMFGEVNDADVRNLAQQAGMLWVRLDLHWSTVEPTNDNADPNTWDPSTTNLGAYATQFTNASNAGLKVIATIRGNPSWAASTNCGPIDLVELEEFAEFLQAVVGHYKEPPYNVKHWEFYNEPDIQVVSVGEDFGGCWGDQGAAYAQMLDAAWEAIHGADPEATVLMGAVAYDNFGWYEGGKQVFNPSFMDDVFGHIQSHPLSGRDYFDWMNFHQYDAFRDNWDGSLPYYQGLLGKAKAIRDKMAAYGLSKPLVCSEVGLQVTTWPGSPPMSTRLELQARHIVHAFVRGASLWSDEMKAMILFKMMSLADPSGLDYGVVEEGPPLNPRPAYYAYQTMTEQLEWGMSFDAQLGSGETGSINIQAYRFVMVDGSKKLVLWTDDGKKIKRASELDIDMAIGPVQLDDTWTGRLSVVDEYGVETMIEDGGPGDRDGVTGSITIQVTQAPVYVKAAP